MLPRLTALDHLPENALHQLAAGGLQLGRGQGRQDSPCSPDVGGLLLRWSWWPGWTLVAQCWALALSWAEALFWSLDSVHGQVIFCCRGEQGVDLLFGLSWADLEEGVDLAGIKFRALVSHLDDVLWVLNESLCPLVG